MKFVKEENYFYDVKVNSIITKLEKVIESFLRCHLALRYALNISLIHYKDFRTTIQANV
jgi:hypothetical protein